jgi:phosphoribosylformylglycinamidine cyclo-ligase
VPDVFGWLASAGGVAQSEMLRTFNCGVGMVVAVSADTAEAVAEVLRDEGETVSRIGTLEPRAADGDAVVFDGALAL